MIPSRSMALGSTLALLAALAAPHRIIFDTDFILPPGDDGMALLLALQSDEVEILGITTVAGNESLERGTSDLLRMLEMVGRGEIPVYRGADMPLVQEKSDYAASHYGKWWSDEPPKPPPGGFAKKTAEAESAYDFIVRTVTANPGEVTIVAVGPLTNVAIALGKEPGLASKIKELVIMGGAVASLPDGGGNITPNAEFNFWVDPEAARKTLRSGVPILLSPLNVSRKTKLTKKSYDEMVASETPITALLKETMGPHFRSEPERPRLMYDQVAMASLIDRTLVKTRELYVDVDIHHGINYGVSVGGDELWPGAEGAKKMLVQYDLDWPRFIEMFVGRLRAPVRQPGRGKSGG
jgi:inosine-uridine nucleoside N-ribohydrolase